MRAIWLVGLLRATRGLDHPAAVLFDSHSAGRSLGKFCDAHVESKRKGPQQTFKRACFGVYLAKGRGSEVGSFVRLIVPLIAECEGARDWDDFVVRITPKTGNQVAIKW